MDRSGFSQSVFLSASGILFLVAQAVFVFTFIYYHYSKDNGLFGKIFHRETNKPFISLLFGILGTVILAVAVIFLVFGLIVRS